MERREEIARVTLANLGWIIETRSGIRCKVEDDGGVGTATDGEYAMYEALQQIAALSPAPASREGKAS